ncbi:hypothetical protein [Nocardia sp. XZ_19_385]|uniref:hypothetical protein n=1 Tax=Nocardia sp. XZ_19_385 TaxID=2769488 RepID=UPI00188DC98D|nr:hypothetical protein [Nocardia sp. XZ_19_385]
MLEPTGPLPPEIYWRRRVFAIGILVVAIAVVIWLAVMIARGGGSTGDPKAAAASATTTTEKQAGETKPALTPDAAVAGASSAAPGPSAPASGAPVAQGQCPDQSLAVKVTVEQPTYKSGEQPVFGIVITNISATACSRDVGSGLQQISVYSLDGQKRLWSSTDCYPDGQPDVRMLNRGEQAAFQVTWSGSTSQPSCAGARVPVQSGAYSVVAQLGSVRSAAEPFNIA